MITPIPEPKRMRLMVNGATYAVRIAGSGPPLLLLHGFSGSAESWPPLGSLAGQCRTIAVDLLGHGETDAPADADRYRMAHAVADLIAILDQLLHPIDDQGGRERFGLIGYSMGARLALRLALAVPDRVAVLILESASPGIEDPDERARRVQSDEELARYTEQKGAAAFTRRWESLPLFASQQRLSVPVRARLRDQRMRNRPKGLANSLRGMGAGLDEPLHERLGELTMPTLLLAGALDTRYAALAQIMGGLIPHAQVKVIPDAGHAIHLEQPRAFEQAVLGFLMELGTEDVDEQPAIDATSDTSHLP